MEGKKGYKYTAAELKEISKNASSTPEIDEALEIILKKAYKEACKGKRYALVYYNRNSVSEEDFYLGSLVYNNEEKIIEELKKLGYTASYRQESYTNFFEILW